MRKLTSKEYYEKYCISCQAPYCNGPLGNSWSFQKCSYHKEAMNRKEEMAHDLRIATTRHSGGIFMPFKFIQNVAEELVEKGWLKDEI